MRVLIATDQWSPDVIGGSARVARATAQQFARLGHQVVVAPAMPGRPTVEQDEAVELHRSVKRFGLPQSVADIADTWKWAVRRQKPDVLVAHQATNAVGLLAAHPRVPLLYVFHASAPLEQRFGLADRIAVVRGGVDFDRFASGDGVSVRAAYGIPADRPFVLRVRRLEPRMGVEELLRALDVLSTSASSAACPTPISRASTPLPTCSSCRPWPTRGSGCRRSRRWRRGRRSWGRRSAQLRRFSAHSTRSWSRPPSTLPAGLAATESAIANTAGVRRTRFSDYARDRFSWETAIESWQAALGRAAHSGA